MAEFCVKHCKEMFGGYEKEDFDWTTSPWYCGKNGLCETCGYEHNYFPRQCIFIYPETGNRCERLSVERHGYCDEHSPKTKEREIKD
jgi:hypothetical protein